MYCVHGLHRRTTKSWGLQNIVTVTLICDADIGISSILVLGGPKEHILVPKGYILVPKGLGSF